MSSHRGRALGFVLAFWTTAVAAQTLQLPQNLIDFNSQSGKTFFFESDASESYFAVSEQFISQQSQTFCGVASMVMVLNALGLPAPAVPEWKPYRTFTQDNVLDKTCETVLRRAVIAKQGMTLDQLGRLLALHPMTIEVHHAVDGGLDEFRASARGYLAAKGRFVLINFLRSTIGEGPGGHVSPLAAYDPKSDRFLMLDVARYKYPPVWVKASELFDSMNTKDSVSNKTRGYVLIAAKN